LEPRVSPLGDIEDLLDEDEAEEVEPPNEDDSEESPVSGGGMDVDGKVTNGE
jgi:hypothetical protein